MLQITPTQRIIIKSDNILHHYRLLRDQFQRIGTAESNLNQIFEEIDSEYDETKIRTLEDNMDKINRAITEKKIRLELAEEQIQCISEMLRERRHVKDDRLDELHEISKIKENQSGKKRTKVNEIVEEQNSLKRRKQKEMETLMSDEELDNYNDFNSLNNFNVLNEMKERKDVHSKENRTIDKEKEKNELKEKKRIRKSEKDTKSKSEKEQKLKEAKVLKEKDREITKTKSKEKEKEDDISDIHPIKTKKIKKAKIRSLYQLENENNSFELSENEDSMNTSKSIDHFTLNENENTKNDDNIDEEDDEPKITYKKSSKAIQKGQIIFSTKELPIIKNNVETLMDWVEMASMKMIYDSEKDEISESELFTRIKRLKNLYFIIIDKKNNHFGAFISNPINSVTSMEDIENIPWDDSHFMFELNEYKEKSKQFIPKKAAELNLYNQGFMEEEQMKDQEKYGGIYWWKEEKENDHLMSIGNLDFGWIDIGRFGEDISYNVDLWKVYDDLTEHDLNAQSGTFTVERLLIVQMK